ncbi:MAG: hypothetical protein AMJ46_00320 [Latescibacteria bacterium DG_63]|nr:MAG: hypothetical protein AMJ46_00320 [Latescibacteria bacterium DG_63]
MNVSKSLYILVLVLGMFLVVPSESQDRLSCENIPEPTFWIEGSPGPWGSGNPFYETRTSFRKKLISYLNTNPSSLPQLKSVFSQQELEVEKHVRALIEAKMIRTLRVQNEESVYAPTFAILSVSDFELMGSDMLCTAQDYADKMCEDKARLDRILADAGLDSTYRLPVFLGLIRDKFFYNYMDEKKLFPREDGVCSQNGKGNFYGAVCYEPLGSKMIYGITHAMKNNLSILYIHDFFNSDSLFESWGLRELWEAKHVFSDIIDFLERDDPRTKTEIERKFRGRKGGEHISSMLSYLADQKVIVALNNGYVKNSIRLDRNTMTRLEEVSAEAAGEIAKFVESEEFADLYRQTTSGENNVSLHEFREVVAWQIIWATPGLLAERGFFEEVGTEPPELYIFERDKTIMQEILEFLRIK